MTKKSDNLKEISSPSPLAIVGVAGLFPKAGDVHTYWSNIREGVDAITDIPATHWDPNDYFDADQKTPDMTYAHRGGFIDSVDFNPLQYGMSPKNIEATDTTQLLGMMIARQALLDAGYATSKDAGDGKEFDRDRTSVIMGVTGTLELVIPLGARLGHPIWREALADAGVDPETAEDVVQRISNSYVPWQENSFPGLLGNVAAGRIANRFDLGGTNCVVDAACASSLSAIHLAVLELQTGRSDMAIAGGLDTFNDIFMYMCFSKTPALSPTGNSRPFALGGDGTILGEGVGAIILKRLADAKEDGDSIYAVIKGMGTSSDGRGNAIYAPSVIGQVKALRDAYTQAQVSPSSIELVEAHGTGTSVGDAVEVEALEQVYRQANAEDTWCALGSVKSMIGHTKSAAGIAGMIKVVMALKHQVLPPTIKVDQPLIALAPGKASVYVNTMKRPWVANNIHPRRAAVSAFGFGGSNFHCVLEEAEVSDVPVDWDGRVLLFAFSADTIDALKRQLANIDRYQSWQKQRVEAAKTCVAFDAKKIHRIAFIVEKDRTGLAVLLENAGTILSENNAQNFRQLAMGISYASGEYVGKIGLLFPGQGTQYVGMLRDLACQFPSFNSILHAANIVQDETKHGARISDIIYPIPVFSEFDRKAQEEILRDTRHAQPAIGVVGLAGLRILETFGFKADFTAGHSYGELLALCAAGVFDEMTLHQLSLLRGSLMAGEAEAVGDRGSMLAILAEFAVVEKFIKDEKLDLVIANHNAPKQTVLSGSTAQIEKATALCMQRKLSATKLPVSAAFHSEFVADASAPFAEALSKVQFNQSTMTVLANTTADVYPSNADAARQLLADQLTKPVRFVEEIEKMVALGVRTFVEVGPGVQLSGLLHSILDGKDCQILSLDASSGKRHGQYDLASLLANLAVLGKDIDLTQWDKDHLNTLDEETTKKPGMTIPLSGANYVMPRKKLPARSQQIKPILQSVGQPSVLSNTSSKYTCKKNTSGDQGILHVTQNSIVALQKMQEQTAKLHQQYLLGQETSQQTIVQLLQQQQALLGLESIPLPTTPVVPPTGRTAIATRPAVVENTSQAQSNVDIPVLEITETEKIAYVNDEVHSVLLEVVAEKTGYPLEMLSLDMSLDTDLGIDSIKRVEILSALQEKLPDAPMANPEELGTFRFLENIVDFLVAARPKIAITSEKTSTASVSNAALSKILLQVVAEKTAYPLAMLNLDMSLDTDLGIDSIKRVEILSVLQEKLPHAPVLSPEKLGRIQTLQEIMDFLAADNPSSTETPATRANTTSDKQLVKVMIEVVADKTGYPVDMLNLEMNLETDLGIDSIKRVEILAALQERMPKIPTVKPEDLGTLQTLQQIVDYMLADVTVSAPATIDITATHTAISTDAMMATIERQILTAMPLQVQQEAIVLPKDSVVWVANDKSAKKDAMPKAICRSLKKKGLNAKMVPLNAVPRDADLSGEFAGLIILTPVSPKQTFMQESFLLLQRMSKYLRASGQKGAAILASVTQMGGQFGLSNLKDSCPISGGIAGLIKTADKEWQEVCCKAIDIDQTDSIHAMADSIVDECLSRDPLGDLIEVGITHDHDSGAEKRYTLKLNPMDIADHRTSRVLDSNDVVIISGGARGVMAEIAYALANTYQTNLLLIGRSQLAEEEAEWLQGLNTEVAIKKAVFAQQGKDTTPKALKNAYERILAAREIRSNLKRIKATGVQCIYCAVDVREKEKVLVAVNEARDTLGTISGFIHGAGVLADKLIEDKTVIDFESVYTTKVLGLDSLLTATENDDLKIMVMFSSSTGRFGRTGQCDYAVANEVLNKVAQQQAALRENCRVISVNWGPWDGGMVTPALKKLFASEGVGVIDFKAGAEYLMQEIVHQGSVEVVILGSTGNATTRQKKLNKASLAEIPAVNMQVAFSRTLNVDEYAFLQAHVMNGRAVLPVAIIIEWLIHGAMHDNPGLKYHGFRNFRVFKGVTLAADEAIDLQILAGSLHQKHSSDLVPVELRGGETLHARAEIILATREIPQGNTNNQKIIGAYSQTPNVIYTSSRLFHGEMLQGIVDIESCNDMGITANIKGSTAPKIWMKNPIRSSWLGEPLAIDSSFQMMILWCFEQFGVGSLPVAIGEYQQFRKHFPSEGCRININVMDHTEHRALATIEFIDQNDQLIARINNYECVIDASLEEAFTQNKLKIPSMN